MMGKNHKLPAVIGMVTMLGGAGATLAPLSAQADLTGFVENASYYRKDHGVSKFRTRIQLEGEKQLGDVGFFSNATINGTFRASYDGVYDINSDEWGDEAGGSVTIESIEPGLPNQVPYGSGLADLSAVPGNPSHTPGPNDGLIVLGDPLYDPNGGVSFGVPVRPCDVDSRGCLDDYMDLSENELRYPEFNDRADFIRELYLDGSIYFDSGDELNLRIGKQQVIWGRTDLFRVLDVINPVDYSVNNIYDELEDIRIPMWMVNAEYRMGPTGSFDDLNFSMVWNFDKFRPHNLGQCGTPNNILGASCFFRGMKSLWDNGGTVSNFANGTIATEFPSHTIGIRDVEEYEWNLSNTQFGMKVEGVYGDLGFSLNAMHYRSQLPSLRGGIPADNPFVPGTDYQQWPYLIAFDIHFPRVTMLGGSIDYYSQAIDTVFRVEVAHTSGEEFANGLDPDLFSESDVVRYVIGVDKNVFIRSINPNRAFLLSAQIFGQHLLDHQEETAPLGKVGMPDWEENWTATFLIKGWWMNDRLSPQIIAAHDFRANASVIAPSIDWLINDSWQIVFGANIKFGSGPESYEDCRTCNPFPPYTATPLHDGGAPGSIGLGGLEPLGRFRTGPIGMAADEDEVQLTIRYRF